jgi:FkbM family methyltransferase
MKQQIVGTFLGKTALAVRDLVELLPRPSQREQLGTVANDQLALQLVTRLCRPHHVFIDVGAHLGSVLGRALDHDASTDVVAIEAVPAKAEHLRRRFPGVVVHACAVGEHAGHASFFVHRRLPGLSSLRRPPGPAPDVDEITVAVRPLDELLAPERVDVVKIDVEGTELAVLRGARRLLERARPTVLFESGAPEPGSNGFAQQALFAHLAAAGYAVVVPNRLAHEDDGLSAAGFAESHRYPRRTTNYFAVAVERRDEIRDRARRILGIAAG